MKRIGVYVGSFDPPTLGHLWMMHEGRKLFDELIIAVGTNPLKTPMFSVAERLEMIQDLMGINPNVKIETINNQYLVDYAVSVGAQYILRGMRNEKDFLYERVIQNVNSDMVPGYADVQTIFLVPPRELCEVSSSVVKSLIGPTGWQDVIRKYLPISVADKVVLRS